MQDLVWAIILYWYFIPIYLTIPPSTVIQNSSGLQSDGLSSGQISPHYPERLSGATLWATYIERHSAHVSRPDQVCFQARKSHSCNVWRSFFNPTKLYQILTEALQSVLVKVVRSHISADILGIICANRWRGGGLRDRNFIYFYSQSARWVITASTWLVKTDDSQAPSEGLVLWLC